MAEPRYYLSATRGNGQKRLYIAIGVSLAIHALFVTYFLFHKGPKVTRKFHTPMHMVELVQKGSPQPQVQAAPPKAVAKPKPKPKPKARPVPKAKPKVKAKPVVKAKPKAKAIPKKAADPVPQRTEADVRDRIAKLREAQAKRVEETAEPQRTEEDVRSRIDALREKMGDSDPAPTTATTSTKPGISSGVEGGRASGVKGTLQMMRFTAYKNRVWELVKRNWIVPPSLKGRNLSAIISVLIDRNGNILKTEIEEPSGNSIFDQAALQALGRAKKLPPVPSEIPDSEIKDGFGFKFE